MHFPQNRIDISSAQSKKIDPEQGHDVWFEISESYFVALGLFVLFKIHDFTVDAKTLFNDDVKSQGNLAQQLLKFRERQRPERNVLGFFKLPL